MSKNYNEMHKKGTGVPESKLEETKERDTFNDTRLLVPQEVKEEEVKEEEVKEEEVKEEEVKEEEVKEEEKDVFKELVKEVTEVKVKSFVALLNVRQYPDLETAVKRTVKGGDRMYVKEIVGDWVYVMTDNGEEGYVMQQFVEEV